jgi:hypothetical protein
MRAFCWSVTILSCAIAAYFLFDALLGGGKSAPQQAAEAAIALGFAIIPYCFTRAIEGLVFDSSRSDIIAALKSIERAQVKAGTPIGPPQAQPPSVINSAV